MAAIRRVSMFTFLWLATWLLLNCGGTVDTVLAGGGSASNQSQRLATTPVPATYFGMHVHRPNSSGEYAWPNVKFGAYRSWDNGEGVCWPVIQRGGPDSYDWTGLDKAVAEVQAEGKEFLYTLGPTPKQPWAVMDSSKYSVGGCTQTYATSNEPNHERWKEFVTKVVQRYCGCTANSHPTLRIKQYEIWNEPNVLDPTGATSFFAPVGGTTIDASVKSMLEMAQIAYTTIKSVDPDATVVSPSATGTGSGIEWLTKYLRAGGGNYADVIGYHAYCFPCEGEQMGNLVAKVHGIVNAYAPNKPLWNTEAGWSEQLFTEEQAAAAVARAYLLSWVNGADRFYFYSWDNNNWTSLKLTYIEDGGHQIVGITRAASAYDQVYNWMVGASVTCGEWQSGMWKCDLTRTGANYGYVLWTTVGSQSMKLPPAWRIIRSRDLAGNTNVLSSNSIVKVGIEPILFEIANP